MIQTISDGCAALAHVARRATSRAELLPKLVAPALEALAKAHRNDTGALPRAILQSGGTVPIKSLREAASCANDASAPSPTQTLTSLQELCTSTATLSRLPPPALERGGRATLHRARSCWTTCWP